MISKKISSHRSPIGSPGLHGYCWAWVFFLSKLEFLSDVFEHHTSDCWLSYMEVIGNGLHWFSEVLVDDILDLLDEFHNSRECQTIKMFFSFSWLVKRRSCQKYSALLLSWIWRIKKYSRRLQREKKMPFYLLPYETFNFGVPLNGVRLQYTITCAKTLYW